MVIDLVPYQFLGDLDRSNCCCDRSREILNVYEGRYQVVVFGCPGAYVISRWLSKN